MADSEKQSADKKKNNWEKFLDLQSKLLKMGYNEKAEAGKFSYQYLSFQKIKAMLQPFFVEYGWVLTQPTMIRDGKNIIVTKIIDVETGEVFLEDEFEIRTMNDNDPQKWGSSITYFRRYTLLTLLGLIADKDDDCFVSDDEIKTHLKDLATVEELNAYYKEFDKDRQKTIIGLFSDRKAEILAEPEKAAENATVEGV